MEGVPQRQRKRRRPTKVPVRIAFGLVLYTNRLSHFVAARRIIFQATAGVLAFALGFWGWMVHAPPFDIGGILSNLFRTAQLVTLQFPTSLDRNIPWQLQIARLAVPLVAVLATVNVLLGSITRPLRLALLPVTSGHSIVCGAEHLTQSALRLLLRREKAVVAVSPSLDVSRREALEALGITCVEADPMHAPAFVDVNTRRAAVLVLAEPDDLLNINLALLALGSFQDRADDLEAPLVAIRIDRDDLAYEWDRMSAASFREHEIRYHRLCPERDGLNLELAHRPPLLSKADPAARTHVLVVGLTGAWSSVLSRLVVGLQDHAERRPLITLVLTEDEHTRLAEWRAARPGLDEVVELHLLIRRTGILPDEDALLAWQDMKLPPQLVVVLLSDADGIAATFGLSSPGNPLAAERASILVRQTRETPILSSLVRTGEHGSVAPKPVAFGGLVRPEQLERLMSRKGDELAIDLYARTLTLAARQTARGYGDSDPPLSPERAWDAASEAERDEVRAQIAHARILFHAAGLELFTKEQSHPVPVASLSAEQIELMARIEQCRRHAARVIQGRTNGQHNGTSPFRTDEGTWDDLSEEERQARRDRIHLLVTVLIEGGAGWRSILAIDAAGAPLPK